MAADGTAAGFLGQFRNHFFHQGERSGFLLEQRRGFEDPRLKPRAQPAEMADDGSFIRSQIRESARSFCPQRSFDG